MTKDERRRTNATAREQRSSSVVRPSSASATFAVKVVPRAVRSTIDGWHACPEQGRRGNALKVRLRRFINAAPPVAGKANGAQIALLAEVLAVGKGQIEIISGETARTKLVRVNGLAAEQIKARLESQASSQ